MRQIKIGAEIEFFGVNYTEVVQALTAKGISVSFEGYTHQVMSCWKLVTDVSVNSRGTGVGRGLELVSPILYGDEGLDELQIVMETLDSIGAKVDRTCGLHIHHDVADYDVENFISLHNLYYNYQKGINSIVPQSRRTGARNTYCKGLPKSDLDYIQNATSISQVARWIGTRYVVLNSQSYVKYGTIEFRQHSGTVEFEKLEAWIVLTHCMVNYCRNNKVTLNSTNEGNLDTLLKKLNLDGSFAGEYLKQRRERLAC